MSSRCLCRGQMYTYQPQVIRSCSILQYICLPPSPRHPDGLPFGSYCSFERDVCGWSVSNQPAAWRRVTGQRMMEREEGDLPGDVLRRTPGVYVMPLVHTAASRVSCLQWLMENSGELKWCSPWAGPIVAHRRSNNNKKLYLYSTLHARIAAQSASQQ